MLETENKYEGNNFSQLLWKEMQYHGASASFLFKQYINEQATLTTTTV